MATLILRPVSDESLNHNCNSDSSGYSLISESSADDDATYIYQAVSSTSNRSVESSFALGGTMPSGLFKITKATLYARGRTTSDDIYSGTYQLSIDSSASSISLGTSYQTSSSTEVARSLINNIYTSSNFPSLSVTIVTAGRKSSSKNSNFQIRITQVYLELEYEEIVTGPPAYYTKINGSWEKITTIYKKIDGRWTEFDYSYKDNEKLMYKGHFASDIVGLIDENNIITLTDESLASGNYTLYYEDGNRDQLENWSSIGKISK